MTAHDHEMSELVADPVSHISISGVHGGTELRDRLARVPRHSGNGGSGGHGSIATLLLGAVLGVAVMYALAPDRGMRASDARASR